MKVLFRALSATIALGIVALVLCASWLYLYSRDLPNLETLAGFAPDVPATLEEKCSSASVRAIPFTSLSTDLQNATRAAEGDSKEMLAIQISRGLFCDFRSGQLRRHLLEYKASVQLQCRFTFDQMLTIYLNRAFFGRDLYGVENASLYYYGKHTDQLNLPEAALITGLIKAPAMYSPALHPDRAKMRRDAVIGEMLHQGTITSEEAQAAMHAPIH